MDFKDEVMTAALFISTLVRKTVSFWKITIIRRKKYFPVSNNYLCSQDTMICFIWSKTMNNVEVPVYIIGKR